jgi:phosphoglycolate phosphatase
MAFDLDGTLIDARDRQVGVASEVLASQVGKELDESRFWRAKRAGATTAQALERIGYAPAVAERAAEAWRQRIESDDWLARDRALPGVARVLAALQRAGESIFVITARTRALGAARSLDAAGLTSLVDRLEVVDPRSAGTAKSASLRRWCAASFIGDTESDGAASRSAGVPFIAVHTGQRAPSYLRARGFDSEGSLSAAVRSLSR